VGVEKQLQARKLLHISFLGVDAWSTVSPWTKEMVSPRPPEWIYVLCFWCPRNGSIQMGMDTHGCMQRERERWLSRWTTTLSHASIRSSCIHPRMCRITCMYFLFILWVNVNHIYTSPKVRIIQIKRRQSDELYIPIYMLQLGDDVTFSRCMHMLCAHVQVPGVCNFLLLPWLDRTWNKKTSVEAVAFSS
jgi:hypothetical protein